jgi:aminodeoxyfutalosine deaminase
MVAQCGLVYRVGAPVRRRGQRSVGGAMHRVFACADGEDDARAGARADNRMLCASRAMEEVPPPQRPLLALHDGERLAVEQEEVLLIAFPVVHRQRLARVEHRQADSELRKHRPRASETRPFAAAVPHAPLGLPRVQDEPALPDRQESVLRLLERRLRNHREHRRAVRLAASHEPDMLRTIPVVAEPAGSRDHYVVHMTRYPKIELHVHLEGTVRAPTLRQIAKRNAYPLPHDLEIRRFRDFREFIEVFELRMGALQTYADFRRVVVEYAAEAASHRGVYLEAIFSPGLWRGLDIEEVFSGYCDGAQEARELHKVEVRLTPDLPGVYSPEQAEKVAMVAIKYRERGVVGLGLVGAADDRAMEPFTRAFAVAREGGLGVVPHAGEVAGPESVRAALDVLGADRIRHGIRAEEDPNLVRELAGRGTVLDVCPFSNVCLGIVASLSAHPLPRLVAAGVCCSISTDDPAMFETDLSRDYDAATSLGLDPRALYKAAVVGALCDDDTRARLREIGRSFAWSTPPSPRR